MRTPFQVSGVPPISIGSLIKYHNRNLYSTCVVLSPISEEYKIQEERKKEEEEQQKQLDAKRQEQKKRDEINEGDEINKDNSEIDKLDKICLSDENDIEGR